MDKFEDYFILDSNPDVGYEGVHDPAVRWNGWACPSFTNTIALEILKDMVRDGIVIRFDIVDKPEGHVYYVWVTEGMDEEPDVYVPDADHRYAIGAYSWTWQSLGG